MGKRESEERAEDTEYWSNICQMSIRNRLACNDNVGFYIMYEEIDIQYIYCVYPISIITMAMIRRHLLGNWIFLSNACERAYAVCIQLSQKDLVWHSHWIPAEKFPRGSNKIVYFYPIQENHSSCQAVPFRKRKKARNIIMTRCLVHVHIQRRQSAYTKYVLREWGGE